MKKLYLSLFVLVFGACTNTMEENIPAPSPSDSPAKENYGVKFADVLKLAQCQKTTTRAADASAEVKCITGKEKDTLLFVCKKPKGGWIMYSSDTRVPPVVAESGSGSFDKLMEIDGARLWIEAMAEDMAAIKRCSDSELKFTKKEIENNKRFWKSISSYDELLRETHTRRSIDPIELPPYPGHYELMYSEYKVENYDSISSLIQTHWCQSTPFNYYCPLKTIGLGHAPAGCVAIAGAQMLYYLHNFISMPVLAPSQAYCIGNVSNYIFDQLNYTANIWESMPIYDFCSDSISAAPLVANVGKRLGMVYDNDGSSARTEDLVEYVFRPYGINSIYLDYNDPLNRPYFLASLLSRMPVILSAGALVPEGGKDGHAFIADRYKKTRIKTTNHYEWVYDKLPPFTHAPYVPDKIDSTYSSPSVSMIGMNWGWGYYPAESEEWFSITGDWIATPDPQYNWNISRHMILGFQPINQ